MSARFHRFALLLSVTLSGMAVLIIEIAATRMLAPYFGNSIFTISSVIGIVLASLGVGYYLGGSLADRKPSAVWFFSLIVTAGFSVLLLQLLNAALLPGIAKTIKGSYYGDANVQADFPKLLGLYQGGRLNLDDMVTRTYRIDQAPQAIADMEKGLNARGVIVY